MYKKIIKRLLDIFLSLFLIFLLMPLFLILIISGAIGMKGNPFIVQLRPGKIGKDNTEHIFKLIKFRSMTNEKDENGFLLPDEKRINSYGKFIRTTSLDELPELINIFIGDMSFVGPRPQLVKDMVFMDDNQRKRHCVRPGLTGFAQINGRNAISWEKKFEYDLEYIKKITFKNDFCIFLKTFGKVLKRDGIKRDGTVSDIDFGDWLLANGSITQEFYLEKQKEAKEIISKL